MAKWLFQIIHHVTLNHKFSLLTFRKKWLAWFLKQHDLLVVNEGKPDHWNIWRTCSTCLAVQAAGSSRKRWWVNWQQLCGWKRGGVQVCGRAWGAVTQTTGGRDRREKASQHQLLFFLLFTFCSRVSVCLFSSNCCACFMEKCWDRKHLKYPTSLPEKSDHFPFCNDTWCL